MSSSANPLPRTTVKGFSSYLNQSVLIIGKLDSQQGSEATFTLNDGSITVHAGTAIGPLELGAVYQVLGKVIDDSSLKAHTVTKLRTTELPPVDIEQRLLKLRQAALMKSIFAPQTETASK